MSTPAGSGSAVQRAAVEHLLEDTSSMPAPPRLLLVILAPAALLGTLCGCGQRRSAPPVPSERAVAVPRRLWRTQRSST